MDPILNPVSSRGCPLAAVLSLDIGSRDVALVLEGMIPNTPNCCDVSSYVHLVYNAFLPYNAGPVSTSLQHRAIALCTALADDAELESLLSRYQRGSQTAASLHVILHWPERSGDTTLEAIAAALFCYFSGRGLVVKITPSDAMWGIASLPTGFHRRTQLANFYGLLLTRMQHRSATATLKNATLSLQWFSRLREFDRVRVAEVALRALYHMRKVHMEHQLQIGVAKSSDVALWKRNALNPKTLAAIAEPTSTREQAPRRRPSPLRRRSPSRSRYARYVRSRSPSPSRSPSTSRSPSRSSYYSYSSSRSCSPSRSVSPRSQDCVVVLAQAGKRSRSSSPIRPAKKARTQGPTASVDPIASVSEDDLEAPIDLGFDEA